MKKIKLAEKGPVAKAIEEQGVEAVLGDKPLPPPPPQFNKPVGDPPPDTAPPVDADFEALFATAHRVRSGKPGMADFWAQMAQARALDRIATGLERLNEYLGVYDGDESEDPDEEPTRVGEVIADGLIGAIVGMKEELLQQLPEPLRAEAEAHLMQQLFGPVGKG